MKHHIINEFNQIEECPYCHNNLLQNRWLSLFESQFHYKETLCNNCEKNIRIKVNFEGSGHDYWNLRHKHNNKKNSSLEEKIKD